MVGYACSQCKKLIPDNMGYASLFYAGTIDNLVLPERHPQIITEWKSFPPEVTVCHKDLFRLPRENLKDDPQETGEVVYGLQTDSTDVISLFFGGGDDDNYERHRRLTGTFKFISRDDAIKYFPKSVKRLQGRLE